MAKNECQRQKREAAAITGQSVLSCTTKAVEHGFSKLLVGFELLNLLRKVLAHVLYAAIHVTTQPGVAECADLGFANRQHPAGTRTAVATAVSGCG